MKQAILTRTENRIARATLKIYWDEMKQEKRLIAIYNLLIPLGYLLYTVLLPLFFSLIIQILIENPDNIQSAWNLVFMGIVVSVAALASHNWGFRLMFNHEERLQTRLTKRAMDHLMAHSYQYFSNTKVGALAGDLNGFIKSILSLMDALYIQAMTIIVNFTASLIIIAFLSPILLVPLGLLTVAIILLSIRAHKQRAPIRNERKRLNSQLFGTTADIFGNQLLVRIFARERMEVSSVQTARQEIEDLTRQEISLIQREAAFRMIALYTFQILTVALCIWLFSRDLLSIAALIFAVTYLGRITGSLFSLTPIIRGIEQALLDAAPITEMLLEPIEVKDAANAKDLKVEKGELHLRDVAFHYQNAKHEAVFDKLNLHIKAGERVGLAGHSGGGKTTLTKLLLRFADIQHGEILIDGQNIAQVTQASLRRSIAYVPQDPYLFHRSLRENLAYGCESVTNEEILAACDKAHASEFIQKLPDGLDTIVGERGIKLSGGQRQRIAIARAILKNAPILILDEATSALDSESELIIQQALEELMRGRTSIVIAHRLSTIQKLDRIIVLDHGAIVEEGPHKQLITQGGPYANLWKHQSGGFIQE